jgi:hypothetical protein
MDPRLLLCVRLALRDHGLILRNQLPIPARAIAWLNAIAEVLFIHGATPTRPSLSIKPALSRWFRLSRKCKFVRSSGE